MKILNLIYNIESNLIECILPDDQNYKIYFQSYPQHIIDNLRVLQITKSEIPSNINTIKVINNNLVKMSILEIDEIQQFGKILTDSERLLNKLKPSYEEVQKAQNTIEILTLIQEVF